MSSEPAIHVTELGKRYRIGARTERFPTLRDRVARAAVAPFRRLRAALRGESARLVEEELWALREVSFSVQPGEVVGVIGRNGAGKTTLLKILARITEPTSGRAEIRGRVGSLLEVGTGFHPELTGRENVFLNGAILGMRRAEIAAKLDEIVGFAEVDRFLDTQVKHYSSGMYLRLAFAVAAHLDPEILLVDEVLAVGDAVFQRRCLGRMGDVARKGRTILFVSHNMEAVQRLCERCLWFDGGRLRADGDTDEVVSRYLADGAVSMSMCYEGDAKPSPQEPAVLRRAEVLDESDQPTEEIRFGEPFSFRMTWELIRDLPGLAFFVRVSDLRERLVFAANTLDRAFHLVAGLAEVRCVVAENVLIPGDYTVTIGCLVPPRAFVHRADGCLSFRIAKTALPGRSLPQINSEAVVAPRTDWNVMAEAGLEAEQR